MTTATTARSPLLNPRVQTWAGRCLVVIAAAVIVAFPLSPSMSAQNTVILALVLAIGASGLNIITGYTGYLSLSQGAFIGIGAYTGAILATRFPTCSRCCGCLPAASSPRRSRCCWAWSPTARGARPS